MRPGVYATAESTCDVEFLVRLEYKGAVVGELPTYSDFVSQPDEPLQPISGVLCEERTIKWQQKIENPFMARAAEEETEGETPPEASSQSRIPRLFTYVEGENYRNLPTLAGDEVPAIAEENGVTKRISNTRSRRVAPMSSARGRNPAVDLPTKENMIKARSVRVSLKTMHIMAYLGTFDKQRSSYDKSDEYLICRVTALNDTTLIFEPDINSSGIELQSRYGLYNATLSINKTEFDSIPPAPEEREWYRTDQGFSSLDMPEEGQLGITYLVEIEKGVNFPHDGLYVEYKIDVPGEMSLENGIQDGCTQSSITQAINGDDVATFAYPFSFFLLAKQRVIPDKFCFPRILFRVCAQDYWGRYYVDGYGFATLPIAPGRHSIQISCWRPIDLTNRKAAMYEYFISQSIDVTSLDFDSLSSALSKGKTLSRIGISMECSGQIHLNVICILQSQDFISQKLLRQMKYGLAMERIGLQSNLHWKILKVLMEFEKAKSKLLEIRDRPLPQRSAGAQKQILTTRGH